MNETIINITLANATLSTSAPDISFNYMLNGFLGIMPWVLILFVIYREPILSIFVNVRAIKTLSKKTGMGVILFSKDVDYKSANKFEMLLNRAERKNIKDIILIIETFGGWEFAMARMFTAIQNFKGNIHCYIPRYSMSAGSLVALSCKSIHMGNKSSIGPVDPQMGILFWVHSSKAWKTIVKKKGIKANDESWAMSLYADQYTKLIRGFLDKIPSLKDNNKFKSFMTSGDIPHSYQIDADKLKSFGINVLPIEYQEIYRIMEKNPKKIKASF